MPIRFVVSCFVIACSTVFFSCQNKDKVDAKTPNLIDLQAEARIMLYRYFEAIKEKGLRAEYAYLDSSDAFYWCPPGATSALNYDSVTHVLDNNADRYRKIENSWEQLHIDMLSSDMLPGVLLSNVIDTSGYISHVKLMETGILVHRVDGWKLLSGQTAVIGTY